MGLAVRLQGMFGATEQAKGRAVGTDRAALWHQACMA